LDIKLKRYSHSLAAKSVAFIMVVVCFTGIIGILYNTVGVHKLYLSMAFENSYFLGQGFGQDCINILGCLRQATGQYKNEPYILSGGTIQQAEIASEEKSLFREFQFNSKSYNPNLTEEENYAIFKTVYADEISRIRADLIKKDLLNYRALLRNLEKYPGVVYSARIGDSQISNSLNPTNEYFKSFPAYMVLDATEQSIYPPELQDSNNGHRIMAMANLHELGLQDSICLAFSDDYLNLRMAHWKKNQVFVVNSLYEMAGLSLIMILAFISLLRSTGRKTDDKPEVHLNFIDKIYSDVNLALCFLLMFLWVITVSEEGLYKNNWVVCTASLLFAALGLTLLLSMVRHIKNKTFLKHTAIYTVFHKLFIFVREVYQNGSLAVKIVLIVIGYPVLAALTFFMFPVTLGLAAWIALKRAKEFNAIKEGVKKVKEGDTGHIIDIPGDGELARLASDINSITDGLGKAVETGIKSERLKSELISNVSHDIRTPLTSIITYIDLLKNEKDPAKVEEYIGVIDQKAQRLKLLTDDLFEAAKATSGSIPVCFETIEIVSLLKQGLGEMDDKIRERRLEFKLNPGQDKLYVKADGKLLWRAIENLFSNILKYALEGSRVYIDVIDFGQSVQVLIKNISAYELNISAGELMERFTRGDESRSSQGSGLGLSIARSLLEIQQGSLDIEIDGDLFKAIIQIGKAE